VSKYVPDFWSVVVRKCTRNRYTARYVRSVFIPENMSENMENVGMPQDMPVYMSENRYVRIYVSIPVIKYVRKHKK